jgi:hypothetical protein
MDSGPSVVYRNRAPTVVLDNGNSGAFIPSSEKENFVALAVIFGIVSVIFLALLVVSAKNYHLGTWSPYSARGLLIASSVIASFSAVACAGFSARSCRLS